LTGATAAYGISALNSFKLATEEVNSGGGIGGRQVELIVEDDHSNIGEVAGIVTKLITQDKVHALLAEPISTRAMVAAPIAQEHKVVMISPAAVKPELTMRGPYIFRACFISPAEGEAIAKFASERLKAKRAAAILDGKNDYAVVLAGFFSEHFKKLGGEIVNEQNYEASDKDVAAQIKAINAAKPDVIFAPGFYSTAGLVAREVKRQNIKAILIGSDGWDSPSLLGAPTTSGWAVTIRWCVSLSQIIRPNLVARRMLERQRPTTLQIYCSTRLNARARVTRLSYVMLSRRRRTFPA
jgi:branched-chain amino acid transport system substrate-binding protein